MTTTALDPASRPRESEGWRAGRPAEDPAKVKRWGLISARPSEYLVHVRAGKVRPRSSGQGASCFKLPWDSVAVVPTSLQTLQFRAEQVTLERVGVCIVGLAVYRIADPLLAYRVLNFSFPERAQEKLERTLTSMFEGASRRIVATLSVQDCLEKRKDSLAAELLREVAPIVGGEGRTDDVTDRGWGVVIDTIEIQDVRVLSEKVFVAMQAPFRAALDQRASEAKAAADQAIAEREAESRRVVEQTRLSVEMTLAEKRYEQARREAEAKRLQQVQAAADAQEIERTRREQASTTRLRELALARAEIEAEVANHALQMDALARRTERAKVELEADAHRRRETAAIVRVEGETHAEVAMMNARAEQLAAEAKARVITAEKLPMLAAAVGQKFGEVKVTQIGSSGDAFGSIAQAVASVIELAKSA